MELAAARALWDPLPGYLNTASYGLPPRPAWEALQAALTDWRHGRRSWEPWAQAVDGSRAAFARLARVPARDVAVGATVSGLVGLIAAALPDDARVLVPEEEFTSNLFPWMVHADRGVRVSTVPAERLCEAVDARTTVVAFSAVQSATGAVARYGELIARAREHGALVVVDATQACGWLPLAMTDADAVAVAGYKWLMGPRGTAFLYLRPELRDRLRPLAAGWFAGREVHDSYYGPPLRLAEDARRLDTSPAWFSWVGAQPALELLERIGVPAVHDHDVGLANRFRAGLELAASNSAIVSVDLPGASERVERAGIRAAVRDRFLRVSFHLYSTTDDVDAALDALTG